MAASHSTSLIVEPREPGGSRQARRLRREGTVPGILYGGGSEPVPFQVSARTLRQVLAGAGAVLDLTVGSATPGPVMVKDLVRHPVSGETMHLDLLRVRLDQKIQATVALELTGADEAPGVKAGGVLEHMVRELTVEALPTDIPDSLSHDVSDMEVGGTLTLASLTPPPTVTLLDDSETVLATLTPPRLQVEASDEIEQETEVVGEAAPAAEDAGAADASADTGADAGSE